MTLELLANEIFFDIFEYLDIVRRFHAFDGLNGRLNGLLLADHRRTCIDFRGLSKNDFHRFCEEYLSLFINRIVALHLPDGDETPNLAKVFLSYPFPSNYFDHLQSLSLYEMNSIDMVIQSIKQYPHLRHFHLSKFHLKLAERAQISVLFKSIWSLPNLVSCSFKHGSIWTNLHIEFTVISTSIQLLIVEDAFFIYDLCGLMKYTPNLSRLSIEIYRPRISSVVQTTFPSIVSLSIKLINSPQFFNSLYAMPNLSHLKIDYYGSIIVGHDWERIINTWNPKLTRFQLKMSIKESHTDVEETRTALLETFRTVFWLEEHQWFVRCVCFFTTQYHTIVYTLPYSFDQISFRKEHWSRSTCSNDIRLPVFDRVRKMDVTKQHLHSCEDLHRLPEQYPNLRYLSCHLATLKNNFCECPPLTNCLTSISLVLFDNTWFAPLQTLLDHSPYLYSLTIFFMLRVYTEMFQLTSASIRRLGLYFESLPYIENNFTENECQIIANSSLGQQCEVLSIVLRNRFDLVDLLKAMTRLRSITVQLKDDTRQDCSSSSTCEDELLTWLINQYPSSYLIIRDKKKSSVIHIWIGSAI